MRTTLLISALLLGACSNKHDGTYVATFTYQGNTCDTEPSDQIGQQFDILFSLYHTAEGQGVADISGSLLFGEDDGKGLDLKQEQTATYSSPDCVSAVQGSSLTLQATYGDDLGLSGSLAGTDTEIYDHCGGQNSEQTCTDNYDMTAIYLNASPGERPLDSIAWGYIGGGGGYL